MSQVSHEETHRMGRPCRASAREAHLPVDCVMGEWRPWGACNACGGERSRRRSIVIYAKNGGRACPAADMSHGRRRGSMSEGW